METVVIGTSAAKNSAGNMHTRYNDKINISEAFGKSMYSVLPRIFTINETLSDCLKNITSTKWQI